MSLCVSNGVIAPVLWPHELTRVDLGLYDPDVQPNWQYIPENADDICDWASVVEPDLISTRMGERRMVYQPHVVDPLWPNQASYEVAVILHGFVSAINLSQFGNWSRRQSHAPAAVRTVILESCGHYDTFECQREALASIEEFTDFVEGATRVPFYDELDSNPLIRTEQNVFVRNRNSDHGSGMPLLPLTDRNDRRRQARDMEDRWNPQPPPPTFVRRPSGSDFPVPPQAIRLGDFVEITVSPVIRRIRRDDVFQPTLVFDIARIVKLRSSFDAAPSTFAPQPILPIPLPSKRVVVDHGPTNDSDVPMDDTLPLSPIPFDDDVSDTEMGSYA